MTAKTASAAPKTAAPKTTPSPKAPAPKGSAKTKTKSPPAEPKASEPARVAQVQPDADTVPAAPNMPASGGIAPSSITPVPFGRLRRAPENVRKTNSAVDIESMADDIAAKGLLQSLIGYPFNPRVDDSTIYIVGGGRRLQALALLAERGEIDADWPVPVLIRAQAEAVDLSLSENLGKRDMNPADEFAAFETLMKPGTLSPADLAKRFGFSERYVKQRLRLAGLADEILDALREGKMTIDAAMAYAGSQDRALQVKVFRAEAKKGWKPHKPYSIVAAYQGAQMTTSDALFKFIGTQAYEAAGGGYEDDLFGDAERWGNRKLKDGHLVLDIARDKVPEAVRLLLAEAIKAHPTTMNILVPAGVRGGSAPKPPKGFKLVDKGYRYNLPGYDKLLGKASSAGMEIYRIASVGSGGAMRLEDRFFVPAADLETVIPPPGKEQPEKTPEEIAAERRVKTVRSVAAWLAAKTVRAGKVEGRQFWNTSRPDLWRSKEVEGIGECYGIGMEVLVTPAEIDAQMDAAEKQLLLDEAEAQIRAQAKEREKAEAAAALDGRKAELLAMDPPPAVVNVDGLDFFRWANGEYWDVQEPEEDDDTCMAEQGDDSLAALIEHADTIGQDWPTIEVWAEYRAAQDAEGQDA
jgi:ParB/RepB/Spo0J family partition protein